MRPGPGDPPTPRVLLARVPSSRTAGAADSLGPQHQTRTAEHHGKARARWKIESHAPQPEGEHGVSRTPEAWQCDSVPDPRGDPAQKDRHQAEREANSDHYPFKNVHKTPI